MKPLRLYWSRAAKDGRGNFGDALSPLVCGLLAERPVEYAPLARCDMVALGSLLQRLPHHWWSRRLTVWGTGLIEEQPAFRSWHDYRALRGHRTAACVRHRSTPAYGEPALLVGELLPSRPAKEFAVGVVPHYKDQSNPVVREFLARQPRAIFVDVLDEPVAVLRRIAQCEVILSSSLHGLAAADALAVPNAWIRLSDLVRGGDFKFHDYYSVFGIVPTPFPFHAGTTLAELAKMVAGYQRPGLARIQADLRAAFPCQA